MDDEVWNGVDIYGAQSEIDWFKGLCIVPASANSANRGTHAIDFGRVMRQPSNSGEYGDHQGVEAWNFRDSTQPQAGVYGFAFDTAGSFPVPIFEHLAELFPTLAFDCRCIHDDDEFCGFGWFNAPPGAESFGYAGVPEGYWDENGSVMRGPFAEARYRIIVERMKRMVKA